MYNLHFENKIRQNNKKIKLQYYIVLTSINGRVLSNCYKYIKMLNYY